MLSDVLQANTHEPVNKISHPAEKRYTCKYAMLKQRYWIY